MVAAASDQQHHTGMLLAGLARQGVAVSSDTTVNRAIELLQQDAGLLALPVLSQGRLAGILSRRELFYSHLAKPFARELFGRKPVETLLDSAPLVLPGEIDVSTALSSLLEHDPGLVRDCFGVILPDGSIGIAAVAELMMVISRSQAELLETLEHLSRRIRNEVELARQVQAALLPQTPMRHAGVSVAAGLVNSTEISGDFYDVFPLDAQRLGLLVADVTGHGVQAGLVTTAAKAGLQTLLDNGVRTPSRILAGINRAIMATTKGNLLMTAVVAVLDQQARCAVISSAGHPYPFCHSRQRGGWHELALDPGFPLGFDDDAVYSESVIPFQPGNQLLLFSDGIQEAEDRQGAFFGEHCLQETLREQPEQEPPDELRDRLLAAARRFRGYDHFEDDVTVLVAVQEA